MFSWFKKKESIHSQEEVISEMMALLTSIENQLSKDKDNLSVIEFIGISSHILEKFYKTYSKSSQFFIKSIIKKDKDKFPLMHEILSNL